MARDDRPEYMKRNDAEARERFKGFADDDIFLAMALSMACESDSALIAAIDALNRLHAEDPKANGEKRLKCALNALQAPRTDENGPGPQHP